MPAGRTPKNAPSDLRILLGKYENSLNWSPKSLRRLDYALYPFIESLGNRPADEIWLSDIREFIRQLDAKGLSPKTQNLILYHVYNFLTWLASQDWDNLGLPHYTRRVNVDFLESKPSREILLNRELNWELLDE